MTVSENNEDNLKIAELNNDTILLNLLNQISIEPSNKMALISEFLENFDGISDEDRMVLTENFKNLPDKDLKDELIDLYEIFNGE